ncbi:MAG TPA: glycosyltransferase family 4 protein, partial [Pyrinomonadaceae bacterium]
MNDRNLPADNLYAVASVLPDRPFNSTSPKILIVAEHASAVFGGEALIPFQYFKVLREIGVDVHLLVHERTRNELEASFPQETERLHFVKDSFINVWCHKIGQMLPSRLAAFTLGALSHFDTQLRQRRAAKTLILAHRFDIVHEPIPVSPKLPSMTFGLAVPVVIGPMNGGMDYPPSYNLAGPVERFLVFFLRHSSAIWNYILPGKRRAAVLLVANERTRNALPSGVKGKPILTLPENGVDLKLFKPAQTKEPDERLRIICVCRLVDWKRVDLLLDACSNLIGKMRFQLDLVGDGPLRKSLEDQVKRLRLEQHVRFHGRIAHTQMIDLLQAADIMVLP